MTGSNFIFRVRFEVWRTCWLIFVVGGLKRVILLGGAFADRDLSDRKFALGVGPKSGNPSLGNRWDENLAGKFNRLVKTNPGNYVDEVKAADELRTSISKSLKRRLISLTKGGANHP
jgi:hypothetical protein